MRHLRPFIIRALTVAFISAAMAVLGVWLLDHDPNHDWTLAGYVHLACSSMVLWTALSFLIARCNIVATLAVGLVSPLVGGFAVCPVASHVYLLQNWKITFSIGVATALLVRLALYLTNELRSQVVARQNHCPQCGYCLRGQTQPPPIIGAAYPSTKQVGARCAECGFFVGAVLPPSRQS